MAVRGTEIVEGHGQLYHRIRARDRAAESLRADAVRRWSRLFGTSDPTALADVVAATAGRSPTEVRRALSGAAPLDDAALVELKNILDAIDREVRRL